MLLSRSGAETNGTPPPSRSEHDEIAGMAGKNIGHEDPNEAIAVGRHEFKTEQAAADLDAFYEALTQKLRGEYRRTYGIGGG